MEVTADEHTRFRVNLPRRMRINSEGIERSKLVWVLSQATFVLAARRIDSCLLCRRHHVNEAALCDYCWATLDERELEAATKWTLGVRP